MRPSQVRRRILEDHTRIREALDALEVPSRALRAGEAKALVPAMYALRDLAQRFLDHLDLEEAILVPALYDADAWGPERAELVASEHAEQRGELLDLLEQLARPATSPAIVGKRLLEWIEALRFDMEHEEVAVLDPDLLRDDVIAIDAYTG